MYSIKNIAAAAAVAVSAHRVAAQRTNK